LIGFENLPKAFGDDARTQRAVELALAILVLVVLVFAGAELFADVVKK
jgi:hypothetical protein